MMNLFFLFMVTINAAFASDITHAFKNKNYNEVANIYKKAQNRKYAKKELIMISYSLRKMQFFRQDIKLNIRLIKQDFSQPHKKLLREIKNGDMIDTESYSQAQKVLYWNLLTDYAYIIKSYNKVSALMEKDKRHFNVFSKILGQLEFREGKADKINDQIVAHMQYLENKVYHFVWSINAQYVSWQRLATLSNPSNKVDLVVTNKGYCVGGDAGYENSFYHFYVDGCFLTGSGGVSSPASVAPTYQQSNVPSYGIKLGPGASMIVSSSKSRIGLRLPIIYSHQPLSDPKNSTYKVDQGSPISVLGSLYSRWQFSHWYFQTEFGKYFQQNATFWGLGLGYNF